MFPGQAEPFVGIPKHKGKEEHEMQSIAKDGCRSGKFFGCTASAGIRYMSCFYSKLKTLRTVRSSMRWSARPAMA